MFTRADIETLVGTVTLIRGTEYARQGMVISIASTARKIVGTVKGSDNKQYVSVVWIYEEGDREGLDFGECSCPVRTNCKHVAALLVALLIQRQTRADDAATRKVTPDNASTSAWEQQLATLIEPVAPVVKARAPGHLPFPKAATQNNQVGLLFDLKYGTSPDYDSAGRYIGTREQMRIAMVPVVMGARGKWIRTGISWNEISRNLANSKGYPASHLTILRSISRLAGDTAMFGYSRSSQEVYLDSIPGHLWWTILADAERDGLPLVMGSPAQIRLAHMNQEAVAQLSVAAQGDDLIVDAQIVLPSDNLAEFSFLVPGVPLRHAVIGKPAFAVVSWQGEMQATSGQPFLLTPAVRGWDSAAVRLMETSDSLVIPAADHNRFLSTALPLLARAFDSVALDESIPMAQKETPALWLVAQHSSGDDAEHAVTLTWQWRYGVVGDSQAPPHVAPLYGSDEAMHGPEFWRTVELEAEIVAAVAERSARLAWVHSRRSAPAENLRGMETAEFFMNELPELRAAAERIPGFNIDVVGDVPDYRLISDVEVVVGASEQDNNRDWFDLAIMIKAGVHEVPFSDIFTALAQGREYLLLIDGSHFPLDDERFTRLAAMIEEARALQDTLGGTLRVSRYQGGLFEELEELGMLGQQVDAWRTALGALAPGVKPAPLPAPVGLQATMRPYQHEGFEWLAFLEQHKLGGILADDMGLGKTLQTIALMEHGVLAASDGDRRKYLVVAPTSVVGNWVQEIHKFSANLNVVGLEQTTKKSRESLSTMIGDANVVVTSYALFRLDFDAYDAVPWAGLILDEAQFVKNHQTAGYRSARLLNAGFKLALTGTPLENNLLELWSILSIVSPGLFPSARRFTEYYQHPIERSGDNARLGQLRRRIAPFLMRRTKDQVATELPAKQENVTEVTLNPRHRKVYDQYLQRERARVLGLVDNIEDHRFEVFRSLALLRQASLDVSLVGEEHASVPSSKLDVLFDMLDDVISEGHNVLIFSQFTQFLGKVRERLDTVGIDYAYLDGSTRKRPAVIEKFTSGKVQIFLISLKAGGFGLNLTAADYCILLDPWWNPAAEAQAVDRAHRIGQERNVMVYRLVATDTIEDKVMALKAVKAQLFSSVMDGGAAGSAGLSADDVRELLS